MRGKQCRQKPPLSMKSTGCVVAATEIALAVTTYRGASATKDAPDRRHGNGAGERTATMPSRHGLGGVRPWIEEWSVRKERSWAPIALLTCRGVLVSPLGLLSEDHRWPPLRQPDRLRHPV